MHEVKARRGADIGSDHHLVVAKIKIRLSARKKQQHNPRVKYDVKKLKSPEVKQEFKIQLQTCFEPLQELENESVEQFFSVIAL